MDDIGWSPVYPDVVVSLDGETVDVVNRVIVALRDHGAHPERRALFVLATATVGNDHNAVLDVCRRWVTEKEEEA